MKIPAHQLAAFYQTAHLRSFSKAADALAVTQSALSQRIANLEDDLEVTLFIRDPAGPILTEAGDQLLRYCQVAGSLEQEVLSQLKSSAGELRGSVRVAAFSSVLRSVVIPALAPFLRQHAHVHGEFRSYEMADLPNVLRNAEADFVILDYRLQKKGVVEHVLGQEEYVVIESAKYDRSIEKPISIAGNIQSTSSGEVYLDHDPQDRATEQFFATQTNGPKKIRRSFMGDIYGIITGVEQGLGRAVMSKHLLKGSRVRVVKGFKRHAREVTLHHFEQPYYSRLHQEVVKQLVLTAGDFLLLQK